MIEAALTIGFLYLLWKHPAKTLGYTLLALVLMSVSLGVVGVVFNPPPPPRHPAGLGTLADYNAGDPTGVNAPERCYRRARAQRISDRYDICMIEAGQDFQRSTQCYLTARKGYLAMSSR